MSRHPVLIVMAGLPGAGKSTVAGAIAQALGCALLSVDPIEAEMWRAGIEQDQPTGLAAYVVAEDLAREQLRAGNDAIIDAVNDVEDARAQWTSVAAALGRPVVFVEVFCSDPDVHRGRLESRRRGILGFPEPTWESVVARREGFERWPDVRLRLDSTRPLDEIVRESLAHVEDARRLDSSVSDDSN